MEWRLILRELAQLRDAANSTSSISRRLSSRTMPGSRWPSSLGLPRLRRTTRSSRSICITTCRSCQAVDARAGAPLFAQTVQSAGCGGRAFACHARCVARLRGEVPIEIIPTGMEMERLCGRRRRRVPCAAWHRAERPVLVHVGRVAFEKNIDFLLRVLLRCEARAGRAVGRFGRGTGGQLAAQADGSKLALEQHVLFVGYQDRKQALLDCYRAGDVFVFASHTETQGLVLLEAMALGVPVVAAAILGTRDILEPGRVRWWRAARSDFADKILRLLGKIKRLRERVGREGMNTRRNGRPAHGRTHG